jgi:hypothetical protein
MCEEMHWFVRQDETRECLTLTRLERTREAPYLLSTIYWFLTGSSTASYSTIKVPDRKSVVLMFDFASYY